MRHCFCYRHWCSSAIKCKSTITEVHHIRESRNGNVITIIVQCIRHSEAHLQKWKTSLCFYLQCLVVTQRLLCMAKVKRPAGHSSAPKRQRSHEAHKALHEATWNPWSCCRDGGEVHLSCVLFDLAPRHQPVPLPNNIPSACICRYKCGWGTRWTQFSGGGYARKESYHLFWLLFHLHQKISFTWSSAIAKLLVFLGNRLCVLTCTRVCGHCSGCCSNGTTTDNS